MTKQIQQGVHECIKALTSQLRRVDEMEKLDSFATSLLWYQLQDLEVE